MEIKEREAIQINLLMVFVFYFVNRFQQFFIGTLHAMFAKSDSEKPVILVDNSIFAGRSASIVAAYSITRSANLVVGRMVNIYCFQTRCFYDEP